MEKSGSKFYNADGKESECMTLLRDLGVNSIRLRVWVNPANGWCNKSDVVAKAWRAHQLGMRLMIDFHYSDSWADPSQQTKPAAWSGYTIDELKVAVANHTKEVLNALKDKGITPEWVQVGNETGNGMLWDEGKASDNMAQYAALNNAGYDAVKSVFSNAKVIVHLQEGNKNDLFRWLFDGLKANGGKWDVIGMSLYPQADTWQTMNTQCVANIQDMISRYGSEVMLCEVGMPWDDAESCKNFLSDLLAKTKDIDQCLGIFYWEPQAYSGWNAYTLGAFDNTGKPTVALDAFKE
ncbi:Arabinogalactan endo-beta-1,4-galactanase [bioreactor metagenome]|uniref:arabinogalactan endo-beta-1,4-galactanase n=1 Tax=bioreactor metagenome TaxID=1076179 RepID=A0A645CT74_9ZZZZ